MIIGVPKEVKDHESRVGITPAGVKALVDASHTVLVQTQAGDLSAFSDDEYQAAGAEIVGSAHNVWGIADMIVKVKEPVEKEYAFFREGLVLFTYLHLAPLPALTDRLLASKVTGIAYETIRDRAGTLPLLTPMSEVAGRMSVQVGATYLEKEKGGRGLLLGGVPGVPPAAVCILGGGIVGTNAAKIALGMGANVTIVDLNLNRLRELDDIFNGRVYTLASNSYNVARAVQAADLLIGGVLIPGAAAPRIVTREMVSRMKKGAVVGEVANDHPQRSLLPGRRSGPLLRHQYAGSGSQHIHPRAHQRHLSVRAEAGAARRGNGDQSGSRHVRRSEYLRRTPHLQGGGAVPGQGVEAGHGIARLITGKSQAGTRRCRKWMVTGPGVRRVRRLRALACVPASSVDPRRTASSEYR
jgi:alanine dehydrogenase